MTDSTTRPCWVTAASTPESRYALRSCRLDGEHRRATLEVGPWATQGNTEHHGHLMVALDHVLGEVLFEHRPEGTWSVTTSLSAAFTGMAAVAGPLTVRTTEVLIGPDGGFAAGEVRDQGGTLQCSATTRTRVVDLPEVSSATGSPTDDVRPVALPTAVSAAEHLGADVSIADDGHSASTSVRVGDWANLFGTLHGGIWGACADLAAGALLEDSPALRLVVSELHLFYSRPARVGSIATVTATPRAIGRSSGVVDLLGTDDSRRACLHGMALLDRAQPS